MACTALVPQGTPYANQKTITVTNEQEKPNDLLDLKHLCYKLVMLIAVITGQRCQSLHLLDLQELTINDQGVVFVIRKLV